MIIERVNESGRTKFRHSLEKLTNSFARRNVAFVINTHSEFVGNIHIYVTGRRGTAQKTIVIVYNENTGDWEAFADGYKYIMITLSEISTIVKNRIQKLNTVLSKI
jgi:hypothetical protein